jgi:hypothetical protein
VKDSYPTRELRVHLTWQDGKPPGAVTVMAKADKGDNPAAEKIDDGTYGFTLIEGAHYTFSAWEDLDPSRAASRQGSSDCAAPARMDSDSITVDGSDEPTKEITLTFVSLSCNAPQPQP